ncbi:MAG: hypothetical protein WCZ89_04845 [Phycisphaerae bacterium]
MSNQPRVAKVLAALLVSMTAGAIVLMAISGNPPSAGPFCLSSYYRLNTIDQIVSSEIPQTSSRWSGIEVYYSQTRAGNVEQLATITGLRSPDELDCHFVVSNGLGGQDGGIESTHRWQKQWPVYSSAPGTIRICVVGDGTNMLATNSQIKRVEALVEKLSRNFSIDSANIFYPGDWR